MNETPAGSVKVRPTGWARLGGATLLLVLMALAASPDRLYLFDELEAVPVEASPEGSTATRPAEERDAERELRRAEKKLRDLAPRGIYIVVDTHSNRLQVKRGETILFEATCSTGSGELLRDPATGREWLFDTPHGRFRVLEKVRDPVWTKPDWAYIELGEEVPAAWTARRDAESLGDYALHFGNGYMIHGTLYQRYLGRSVTHGCIRLGDEDLERVFEIVPTGAEILIY